MQLKKFLLFGLIAAVLPALAEEAADRKTATSLNYVEHELDTRQNKFTAEANKAMEYTNAAGVVQKRAVTSDLDNGGTDSLPMVGGVNTKLDTKQDDIDPVNDRTAVTYTGQPGGIGQKGIYQTTGTYVEQSDNLIDAKTFNAALKKGLDTEFKCKEFKPDTNLCWVYSIHNATEDNTLLPAGYIPLEYIESNGTQYINLGDGLCDYFWLDFMNIGTTHGFMLVNGTTQIGLYDSRYGTQTTNTRFQIEQTYDSESYHFVATNLVNGTSYVQSAPAGPYSQSLGGLFALKMTGGGAGWSYYATARVYGFRASYQGTMVRNLIPARHNNILGMYDTVSQQFFTNDGDGEFTAGPEINTNNIYIPQNQ